MPGANAAIAFGALVAGLITLEYGVKSARSAFAGNSTVTGGTTVTGWPTSVNPLPGATASRLDQGIDATGRTFLAPWAGHVVAANAHSSGWKGGGYIAIQSNSHPDKVFYLAEGIAPIVGIGEKVTAGQRIAYPVANPYNGVIGNVEAGLADPQFPTRPLAQAVSSPENEVLNFYDWLLHIGGPKAISTSGAGHG